LHTHLNKLCAKGSMFDRVLCKWRSWEAFWWAK